jgi:antitoxin (DNA-binding transcriptional repressor) of toxin-antitoxin stability system
MKTYTVGDLKTHFSEVMDMVQEGEEIYVTYGKKKEIVAQIVSPQKKQRMKKRKLGLLKGKASFKIHGNWKMTEEEFFNS